MNKELLQQVLKRIELDWHLIESTYGPYNGGLEGSISRGEDPLILELRTASIY